MTTLFDCTHRRKTNRRVFAQGVPTSDLRSPYTAADLAWWAAQNADQPEPDWDRLAAEAAWQDRYEAGCAF